MNTVFKKPHALTDTPFHYCPGCTHGIIHRLVAEALDELGIEGDTIGVAPVGCAYNNYEYFSCDVQQAAHGRAPAVATGIKRVHPGKIVFTYQGDGDLAAIGTAEIVHAAARGEKITTVFVNNAIYGMTSGQMAPTTLLGQVTSTSPVGRKPELHGYPINICEMLATLDAPIYIERVAASSVKHINAAKRAIKKAFSIQKEGLGFTIVEVLSTCPTNWGMSPIESMKWLDDNMIKRYPLGVFRDRTAQAAGSGTGAGQTGAAQAGQEVRNG
ncbi:MAG: 2-oxoglutarate oxidoreductase [Clostridiales bacterium]|jgi:2-oxoglutarate ferredoxin oxidoreductase subunit beta|nr:2-oxoglutarate oxidoreductase [Clostridiales bacterium]